MDASTAWINDYLDPPATAQEQAELLTAAGFPLEGRAEVDLGGGRSDVCQDFEMTSNRGDCICHVGLAREIAAISGRSLRTPKTKNDPTGPPADSIISVTNHEPQRCPLYTGRVIRGVSVGPSPDWLADRLRAIGQIPRNCIVDATNYVLFELGQPTHVFDLAKISGHQIIVRMARARESFLPIGEGEDEIRLSADDLVIADAENAVAIGGVKGGALSAVTETTTDILIEAATFDPVTVRDTSRRLRIDSASSYRYERGVHAAQIEPATERLVQLILELAGGELCHGAVADGAPIPPPQTVRMRPARARKLLGVEIANKQMVGFLDRLGFAPKEDGNWISCTVPTRRLDIHREVDLIEEVGRMSGYADIPVADVIVIQVSPPQPRELAKQAVSSALVGMGYVETITHSLVSEKAAAVFLRPGERPLRVEDERAKAEPVLRPSLLPSLLRVRALNNDRGVGPLKLFEAASTFVESETRPRESRTLAILENLEDESLGLRPLRGAIERLIAAVAGPEAVVGVESCTDIGWLQSDVQATVAVNGEPIGRLGLIAPAVREQFGLDMILAAGELEIERYYDTFPPETEVKPLPAFPAIERDVSAIVDEDLGWQRLRDVVEALRLPMLDSIEFITTFRGKQVGGGRKSCTMRARFRAPDRTLTHDEVSPQIERIIEALRQELGATLRS